MEKHLYIVSYKGKSKYGAIGDFCAELTLSNKWGVGDMDIVAKSREEKGNLKSAVITSIFYAGEVE